MLCKKKSMKVLKCLKSRTAQIAGRHLVLINSLAGWGSENKWRWTKARGTVPCRVSLLISWPSDGWLPPSVLAKKWSQYSSRLAFCGCSSLNPPTDHSQKNNVTEGCTTGEVVQLLWFKSTTRGPRLQLIAGIKVSVSQVNSLSAAIETNPRRPDPS